MKWSFSDWTTVIWLSIVCAGLLASGVGFAPGVSATGHTDEIVSGGGGSGGANESMGFEYGPDITIPDNGFRIFYSGDRETSRNTTTNASQLEIDRSFEDVRSLDQIAADGRQTSNPEAAANTSDWGFRTTNPEAIVNGRTLGEYRVNQLVKADKTVSGPDESAEKPDNIVTDTAVIQAEERQDGDVRGSHVPRRFNPEREYSNTSLIADAYVGIFGINGGSKPKFEYGNYGPVKEGEDAPTKEQYLMGESGEVLEYVDFRFNPDNVPETVRNDPITKTGTARSYTTIPNPHINYNPDAKDYQTNKNVQTETAKTHHVETYYVDRQATLGNRSLGQESGMGGQVYPYNETEATDVEIRSNVSITAQVYEYNQKRTRYRIYDSRDVDVTATTTVTAEGRGTCIAGPNQSSCTVPCTANDVTQEVTKTYTGQFDELGGDRTIDVNEEVEMTLSGDIKGECTESVDSAGLNFIEDQITGDITETKSVRFHYDYWDHWSSKTNRDVGGWEVINKTQERSESVQVEDSVVGKVTDNNPINVTQVSVQAGPGQYHNIVGLEYPGHTRSDEVMSDQSFDDQYLWSLVKLGNSTAVKSELYSYSRTKIGQAANYTEDEGTVSSYDPTTNWYAQNEENFANQQELYTYSTNTSLTLLNSRTARNYNTRISGWSGVRVADAEVSESGIQQQRTVIRDTPAGPQPVTISESNVDIETYQPVMHQEFVVRNAPSPATEIVSIHGNTRNITANETRHVEYARPDVNITTGGNPGEYIVEVTGKDGVPLPGREVIVSTTSGGNQTTTDAQGKAYAQVVEGTNHVEVAVEGDSVETILADPTREVFYESVTAEKTTGVGGVVSHLWDLIKQLLIASPLLMLYLFWRDSSLGE